MSGSYLDLGLASPKSNVSVLRDKQVHNELRFIQRRIRKTHRYCKSNVKSLDLKCQMEGHCKSVLKVKILNIKTEGYSKLLFKIRLVNMITEKQAEELAGLREQRTKKS